jgi:hypothetical protein
MKGRSVAEQQRPDHPHGTPEGLCATADVGIVPP